MKRALALTTLAVALLVPPATLAAPPTNTQLAARLKALETKVATQAKTVASQAKTIKTLETAVATARNLAGAGLTFAACGLAITADAFQGEFSITDQIAVNTPNVAKTFYGAQTPVNDQGACTALQVVRTQVVPPTTAPFSALLSLLRSSAAFDG